MLLSSMTAGFPTAGPPPGLATTGLGAGGFGAPTAGAGAGAGLLTTTGAGAVPDPTTGLRIGLVAAGAGAVTLGAIFAGAAVGANFAGAGLTPGAPLGLGPRSGFSGPGFFTPATGAAGPFTAGETPGVGVFGATAPTAGVAGRAETAAVGAAAFEEALEMTVISVGSAAVSTLGLIPFA